MALKILEWDIEMAPAVAHVWGTYDQNLGINQVIDQPYMLSFAARWRGSRKVIFKSVFHNGKEDMVNTLWSLLDEADALISWNGKGFDTKHANREFLQLGLTPPSPVKEIDLMLTARSVFRFLSNKLDYVAQLLGIGQKKSTGGHELWIACMNGDPKAWAKMRRYNIQDVNLLDEIYTRLLPWITNHPNVNLYGENGCPTCGSKDVQKRGFAHTGVSSYQRYQCKNCGKWSKDGKAVQRATLRQS